MTKFFKKHERIFCILTPVLVGIIFIILACLNLDGSIWFDESYSAYLVRGGFGDIWHLTSLDVHPPMFYFALKVWSSIFGTDVVTMRFMSIFFGLIAIVFIFHLLKRWFNVKTATVSTLLLSISPAFIRYGQEMRMYTMVLAIVAAATFVLTLALDQQKVVTEATGKDKKSQKKLATLLWIIYAVLVSLGMWTHYFSAFVWIAELIFIVHYFGGIKALFKDRSVRKNFITTYVVAVALYIPWIPDFFRQVTDVQGGFWIPDLTAKTILDYFGQTFLFSDSEHLGGWGAILFMALLIGVTVLAVRAYKTFDKTTKKHLDLLVYIALIPLALLILASVPPLKPMFIDRYILYSMLAIWLIMGVSIIALSEDKAIKLPVRIPVVIITTAIVLGGAVFGVINVENREPKGFAKDILVPAFSISRVENEPVIVKTDWLYYDAMVYSSDAHPVYFPADWSKYQWGSLEPIRTYRANLIDNLDEFTEDNDYFWFIIDTPEENTDEDKTNDKTNEQITADFPKEFKNHRVINYISDEHHIAFELERNNL